MPRPTFLIFITALAIAAGPGFAADWPTWRADPQRSGYTSEELPPDLQLQWTRELPPPTPAWPAEPRSQFDAAYEPVVAGSRLVFGSSHDGRVWALDARSGEMLWRFSTNGPVRLAPAIAADRVLVGSDDGFLYCLDLGSGKLLWQFRGGPDARTHLGNERLVSLWPIRGGPVIAEGIVYFTAGIWPTMGVYIHALDVASGKPRWTKRHDATIQNLQVDHDFRSTGGLSPQGHLIVTGDTLIVPNGRSMPAYFDRKTGRLLHYLQGFREGNCRIAANDDVVLIGNYFYPLRQLMSGENDRFFMVRENPGPAPFDAHAFSQQELVGLKGNTIRGFSMDKAAAPLMRSAECPPQPWWKPGYKYAGRFSYQSYKTDGLWSLDLPAAPAGREPRCLIHAGSRLYVGRGKNLSAVVLPGAARQPAVAWTKELPSAVASLLVASGRLYVVTADGAISCFGPQTVMARRHPRSSAPLAKVDEASAKAADEILRHGKNLTGYCLVLGVDSGRLVTGLLQRSQLRLIVIEDRPQRAEQLRDRLIAADLYGLRSQVFVGDPRTFHFPPYLADLIVSERLTGADLLVDPANARRLLASLRPGGGVVCLRGDKNGVPILKSLTAGNEWTSTKAADGWIAVCRQGPLAGTADWSHPYGDAGNTLFSRDTVVRPPLGVLWYGHSRECGLGGLVHLPGSPPPVVTRGVMCAIENGKARAIDAYTGRLLWQSPVPGASDAPATAWLAAGDGSFYLACGPKLLVLDAVSGHTRRSIEVPLDSPPGRKAQVTALYVADAVAVVLFRFAAPAEQSPTDSSHLVAIDCTTGKRLWSRPAQYGYSTVSLATRSMVVVGGGRVMLADTLAPHTRYQMRRRGEKADAPCTLAALELRTGKPVWTEQLVPHGSGEYLAYSAECGVLLHYRTYHRLRAIQADSGKVLWEKPFRVCFAPMMVGPKQFYAFEAIDQIHVAGYTMTCNAYDLLTGDRVRENIFQSEQFNCNYAHAAPHLLLRRDINTFASWIDLAAGGVSSVGCVRSGCTQSLIPAAGLVIAPNLNYGCGCNYPLQTSYALLPW